MFTHHHLEDAETQIRLVQVLPGYRSDTGVLKISVHTLETESDELLIEGVEDLDETLGYGIGHEGLPETSPDSNPSTPRSLDRDTQGQGDLQYTALSYMWGPPEPSNVVLLNGEEFVVRRNLWSCLRVLRKRETPEQYYWIDQLCIDQENLAERAAQVQRMDRIYSYADHVLVWLGGEDHIDTVLQLAGRCISRVFAESLDAVNDKDAVRQAKLPRRVLLSDALQESGRPLEAVSNLTRLEDEEVPLFKQAFQLALDDELIDLRLDPTVFRHQLQRLRQNPYWRRAWIIQETLLAANLRSLGLANTLPWAVFALFHEAVRSIDEEEEHREALRGDMYRWRGREYNGLFRILDTRAFDRGEPMPHGIPFALLMTNMPSAECADIRDRFYSILGLIPHEKPFEVDYAISVRMLYFRILDWLEPSSQVVYVHTVAVLLDLDEVEIMKGITDDERKILELHRPPDMERMIEERFTYVDSVDEHVSSLRM